MTRTGFVSAAFTLGKGSAFRRVKSGVLSLLKRYILDMENAENAKRNNSRFLLFIMVVVIVIVQTYGKKITL